MMLTSNSLGGRLKEGNKEGNKVCQIEIRSYFLEIPPRSLLPKMP